VRRSTSRLDLALALLTISSITPSVALAANLIPGPEQSNYNEELGQKADAFGIQLHQLVTPPIGFSLDIFVLDEAKKEIIDQFFASGERDFQKFTGKHPYEVIDAYEEYAHSGIFGGVQVAGDAFRYAVLRDSGAPDAELEDARAAFLNGLDALDWFVSITGAPGVVARGLRRVTPKDGEPPLPGEIPATVPLFDDDGDPLPEWKAPTWRADRSGRLPFLIWLDDTSRDTFIGYVFALGIAYDIGVDDPKIPQDKIAKLSEHARAIGLRLLEKVRVADGAEIDLVLQDADGRPTTYHALSAEEILEGIVGVEGSSGFNALMALGTLRTLYHVSGEPKLWVHYQNLIKRRRFFDVMESSLKDISYFHELTNYTQVNMNFLAAYGLLRYENDPDLAIRARGVLETEIYAADRERCPKGLKMSFYDLIYAAFRTEGIGGPGKRAVLDGMETLVEHPSPPYWDHWVENCDGAEIEALSCVLLDGTRVALSARRGYGNERVVAVDPIPMRVRPPSDFIWRSDPHAVNGGGLPRLNPGGDFHAAYWLGRFLVASESGLDNISPIARGVPDYIPEEETTCACNTGTPETTPAGLALVAMVIGLALARLTRRN
jgi:hypothetical protein